MHSFTCHSTWSHCHPSDLSNGCSPCSELGSKHWSFLRVTLPMFFPSYSFQILSSNWYFVWSESLSVWPFSNECLPFPELVQCSDSFEGRRHPCSIPGKLSLHCDRLSVFCYMIIFWLNSMQLLWVFCCWSLLFWALFVYRLSEQPKSYGYSSIYTATDWISQSISICS